MPTCFWPYSQNLDLENVHAPGEITGKGLRVWDKGVNRNDLQGQHYEGTLEDFRGEGLAPS